MARGVLPVNKDDSGAIFLDRDAKYFQLILNYLRDGWCSLPKSQEERRELLQEIRYYQLAGMEAWMHTQDVIGEAALRPQSADPYSSPVRASLGPVTGSPYYSSAEGSPAVYCSSIIGQSPGSSPIRSSFVHGPNQDLLTASLNVRSSLSPAAAATSPAAAAASLRWLSHQSGSPEPVGYGTGLHLSPSPVAARPSSAAAGSAGGMATAADPASYAAGRASYAAGFQAGAAAERQSVSYVDGFGMPSTPSAIANTVDASTAVGRTSPGPLPSDGYKWTGRYLQSNTKMQQVVETLLELAYIAPHPSLHAGKSTISITSECDHDRMSSLLGAGGMGIDSGRFRHQVVRVQNSSGWTFEFSLRPSSDLSLYDKYNIAEYIQDNFFVLTAVMKDQYGVLLEEDNSTRPKCVACRRSNVTVTMQNFV